MPVVVVESPAKARTIERYLGKEYRVLATFGHVRDLPPKPGSVIPDSGFDMKWAVDSGGRKHVANIANALKGDNQLVLATDPDREGEAISWHVLEALRRRRSTRIDRVDRITFNAITSSAVRAAMAEPRQLDMELVQAYLARRALDYLVGFTLSPVLWSKLPGARSAGRVQSVALRLVVEREIEVYTFESREYWTVVARLANLESREFEAELVILDGKKLKKFDIPNRARADHAVEQVNARDLKVDAVDSSLKSRRPTPPFMTATLQQEASRKLGFGTKRTMSIAQKLYEAGMITYMRTDAIFMAAEAVRAVRQEIERRFGSRYLPSRARHYKNKAKNVQEAHECIRPTDFSRRAPSASSSEDERKIYDLIWKRAVASQMADAKFEQTIAMIGSEDKQVALRARGRVMLFDGFLKLYEEGTDDDRKPAASPSSTTSTGDKRKAMLPRLAAEEPVKKCSVKPVEHATKPPPRFSEAMLVKRLVELGIGRPSTYATIVGTIQSRGYVRREGKKLVPEGIGVLLTFFLQAHFERYVDYQFTAKLEEDLDDISAGRKEWKDVLKGFWQRFNATVGATSDLKIGTVLQSLAEQLAPRLIREIDGPGYSCPRCGKGTLTIKVNKSVAYFRCSEGASCDYKRDLLGASDGDNSIFGRILGKDANGLTVSAKKTGRYGPYLQLGPAEGSKDKPKFSSIPKGMDPDSISLETALGLLSLPREIGSHPEDGKPVHSGIGRYGPYVRHNSSFASLTPSDDVLTVGMNRAVELLARKSQGRGGTTSNTLAELGEHPKGGPVRILNGRYGPYVKWKRTNVSLPKGSQVEDINLAKAVDMLERKKARKRVTRRKGKASRK